MKSRQSSIVRPVSHTEAHLGSNQHFVAPALERPAEYLFGSSSICVKANGLVFSNALIGRSDSAWETPKVPKRRQTAKFTQNTPYLQPLTRSISGHFSHRLRKSRICAGGFLAGSFPAPYNSFNLSSGVKFGFYSAEEKGTRKAAVRITTADGPALDQYWEDGPQFTGWGEIIVKYPDGSPAIVEGSVGQGRVILSGVHPEAPESWRRGMTFATPASMSTAYAMTLIDAALNGKDLAHH